MRHQHIIKSLLLLFVVALTACSKEEDTPTPAPTPPDMQLTLTEVSLMQGLHTQVGLSNASQVSITPNTSDVATLTHEKGQLNIRATKAGSVTFKITDATNGKRSVSLKVNVVPVKFGIMENIGGAMKVETKYRYQTPKTLHTAVSATDRKTHFLKLELPTAWKEGEATTVLYKDASATQPNPIKASVLQLYRQQGLPLVVYLVSEDKKQYFVFPILEK